MLDYPKILPELNHLDDANEPIGVSFAPDAVDAWHKGQLIATFPEQDALMVKISHNGELVAILTRSSLHMYDVKTNVEIWELELSTLASFDSGHELYFSADDTKLLMAEKMEALGGGYVTHGMECQIIDAIEGDPIKEQTSRDCTAMANKFCMDLDKYTLTCGVNIGDATGPLIMDFAIVANWGDDILEDGTYVKRHYESQFDEDGFVIRLIARQVDEDTIFIMCIKSNGVTLYSYDTNTWLGSPVGTLFVDPADGIIINGGISSDLGLIAILTTLGQVSAISFYDVRLMKLRYRKTTDGLEELDEADFNDKLDYFELQGDYNILLRNMVDKEIIVSSTRKTATIYSCIAITTASLQGRKVVKKHLQNFCVTYSDGVNFLTTKIKQEKSVALCMGLHERLGLMSKVSALDPELVRILTEKGVCGEM